MRHCHPLIIVVRLTDVVIHSMGHCHPLWLDYPRIFRTY